VYRMTNIKLLIVILSAWLLQACSNSPISLDLQAINGFYSFAERSYPEIRLGNDIRDSRARVQPVNRTITLPEIRDIDGKLTSLRVEEAYLNGSITWIEAIEDTKLLRTNGRGGFDYQVDMERVLRLPDQQSVPAGKTRLLSVVNSRGLLIEGPSITAPPGTPRELIVAAEQMFSLARGIPISYAGRSVSPAQLELLRLNEFLLMPGLSVTAAASVIGESSWQGRPVLLVNMEGTTRIVTSNNQQSIIPWRGLEVVDIKSGFVLASEKFSNVPTQAGAMSANSRMKVHSSSIESIDRSFR
jgi:hypothetical protein